MSGLTPPARLAARLAARLRGERSAESLRTERMHRLWQLGELAASLSHDLGQPLNIVRLNAEAGLDALDRDAPARSRRGLEIAVDQAVRMQDILDRLVGATRRPDRPAAPVSPADAVRLAAAEAQPRFDADAVALRWECDPATPKVLGHRHRLEAALAHLLANAAEAVLAAALAPAEPPRQGMVAIRCRAEAGQAVIMVEDNGCGFPPELRVALEGGRAAPAVPGKGCGLGLAVAFGVIAEMGGDVVVEDARPGTRVVLRLPAAAERATESR